MSDQLAGEVIEKMLQGDLFSQWMQIQVIEIKEGYSKLRLVVRQEMINGLDVVHGGIIFSLADTCFAFACNSRNHLSLALDVSVTYNKAAHPGDILVAEAREIHNGRRTGLYIITVTNQSNEHVALFKGTCYRTGKSVL